MRLPHVLAILSIAALGCSSAAPADAAALDSSPASSIGSMPAGEFQLRDGRIDRPFRLLFDQAISKPAGESPVVVDLPPGITNTAELRAYLESQEATDPYTRIHLLAAIQGLPEPASFENGGLRSVTEKIAFKLREGARSVEDGTLVAESIGAEHLRDHILESGWTALGVERTSEVFEKLELLRSNPQVEDAYIATGAPMSLRACDFNTFLQFFPNDEYYGYQTYFAPPVGPPNNPWEPFNPWAPIVTVRPIWENASPLTGLPFLETNYLGTGVTVGVADDGLHTDHPDLRRNVNRNLQNDWIGDDSEPSGGVHGTRAGGLIASIGRNRVGFTGTAPRASIAGLRFFPLNDDGFLDDELISEVFDYKSGAIEVLYNGWGPGDNFLMPVGPGELSMGEIEANVRTRNRIFIIGAGNGASADDTNYDGFANSIYTIPVGSVNPNFQGASYSEVGANIICATIGQDGPFPAGQLFSTNGAADYIRGSMDGTSYSAAVLSGIVALMLEANPRLGWRDVQEILIASCLPVGPPVPNGGYTAPIPGLPPTYLVDTAGSNGDFPPSHSKTGYGFVDAATAVFLSEIWPNLPDGGLYKKRSQRVVDQELIERPLGQPWGLGSYDDSHAFFFDFGGFEDMRVEHVEVTVEWAEESDDQPVDIVVFPSRMPSNVDRGLSGFIPTPIHPEGWMPSPLISSRLSRDETFVLAPQTWTSRSVMHWGRSSAETPDTGIWEVHLGVDDPAFTRELREIKLTLYGTRKNNLAAIESFDVTTTLNPGVPLPPTGQTNSGEDIIISDLIISDIDFDPVRVKYQWQELDGDSVTWIDMPAQSGEILGTCNYEPVAGFEMSIMREGATVFTEGTVPRTEEPVQFTSTSFDVGGSIVAYDWDLGDGTTSTLPNPIVPAGYFFPDPITVSLTVTDDSGFQHTHAFTFTVIRNVDPIPDPQPEVTSAFDIGTCHLRGRRFSRRRRLLPARRTGSCSLLSTASVTVRRFRPIR